MRKVLVFGAAVAATCVSAVGVPTTTQASATPAHAGAGPGGRALAPPAPPTPPAELQPAEGRSSGETETVSSARGVMVTPTAPRSQTYAYGRDPEQRLDAYWRGQPRPAKGKKAAPRPGILLLHGGYWTMGDKAAWRYTSWRLSSRGYAVFSANYRLAPAARWPAQRDDATAAIDFIKRNAWRWNLDTRRIVAIGSSAGGQLATMLGTYGTGGSAVRGVVAMSPPNSPSLAYVDGGRPGALLTQIRLRDAVRQLVGCTPSQIDASCAARLDDASSATHAGAGDAPMLLLHSAGDFVPAQHSTVLAGALRDAGVPVTLDVVPGGAHGPSLLINERIYQRMVEWIHAMVSTGR